VPGDLPDDDVLRFLGIGAADRTDLQAALPFLPERTLRERRSELIAEIGTPEVKFDWPAMPGHPAFYPWVFLSVLPEIRAYHRDVGVPDEVSRATLADLGHQMAITRRSTGRLGLAHPLWLTHHYRGALFQLGRLQFHRRPAQGALDLHVPAIGPLTPDACDSSLEHARAFFAGCYPRETFTEAMCISWLLDPALAEYLPSSSNVVAFQRRFRLLPYEPHPGHDDDLAVLDFVFGRAREPLADGELETLPRRTSLERGVVAHLRAGRRWHFRHGRFPLG
jgi:hypothetical protein